jgi:C4-dicarboxylate-specific signal transduction histidine kinase
MGISYKKIQHQLDQNNLTDSALPTNLEDWKMFLTSLSSVCQELEESKVLLKNALNTQEEINIQLLDQKEKTQSLIALEKKSDLGVMASGIAHEINNPLSVISTITSLISVEAENIIINKEEIQKYSENIETMVFRIAKIVKGLKTFSHECEHDPFQKTSMKSIVEGTLLFCQARLESKNISLKFNNNSESFIQCHPGQISQVLLNLLNNAADAIEHKKGKWIHIETKDVENFVQLSVTDSGLGISESLSQKIFNPFFTTKEVGKGTGIGLSISKGIIQKHNGSIDLDSNHSNTRFVISIPKN